MCIMTRAATVCFMLWSHSTVINIALPGKSGAVFVQKKKSKLWSHEVFRPFGQTNSLSILDAGGGINLSCRASHTEEPVVVFQTSFRLSRLLPPLFLSVQVSSASFHGRKLSCRAFVGRYEIAHARGEIPF